MRTRLIIFSILLGYVFLPIASATPATPEEEYRKAYRLIRTADRIKYGGDSAEAAKTYREALSVLDGICDNHPAWHPSAIKQKTDYCTQQLWQRYPDVIGRNAESLPGKKLVVSFIDVGQGDSTLIEFPNGQNVLIDGGKEKAGEKVVRYLKGRAVGKIDLIIATHPDADHIGGLIEVINNFRVKKLIDPGKSHTTSLYARLLELVKKKNLPYKLGRQGDHYQFGEVTMRVLNPTDSLFPDTNNCSVVVELQYGEIKFLLPGDAAQAAELFMFQDKQLSRCQILKVGHHGSSHSSTEELLRAVKPEVAFISCGKENHFGHPSKETIERLTAIDCEYYRTDEQGNLRVETNGKTYRVILEKKKPRLKKGRKQWRAKTNINIARYEQLLELHRIGPVKAQAIIDYRAQNGRFSCIDDIVNVPGIGPKTLEKLRDVITVGELSP